MAIYRCVEGRVCTAEMAYRHGYINLCFANTGMHISNLRAAQGLLGTRDFTVG